MAAAQSPAHVILDFTFDTASDLSTGGHGPNSTHLYEAVKFITASDLTISSSSTAAKTRVAGIAQTASSSGGTTVRMLGLSKHVVDGTTPITQGDWLAEDGNGVGKKTTSANDEIYAMALQNSTAQYDIISVFVLPGQRY